MSAQQWTSCPACRALLEPRAAVCPYCHYQLKARPAARTSAIAQGFARSFPITTAAIAFCCFLFLAQHVVQQVVFGIGPVMGGGLFGLLTPLDPLIILFGGPVFTVLDPWWVWITQNFLHLGILHLLMNMYAFRVLGPPCERLLGRGHYLLLIAFTAFTTGLFTHVGKQPAIGASGILCGLLGALLVYTRKERNAVAYQQLLHWAILIGILSILPGLGISLLGHAGGFVGGLVFMLALFGRPLRFLGTRRGDRLCAGVAIAVLVLPYGGLIHAVLSTLPYRGLWETDRLLDRMASRIEGDARAKLLPEPEWTERQIAQLRDLDADLADWPQIREHIVEGLRGMRDAASERESLVRRSEDDVHVRQIARGYEQWQESFSRFANNPYFLALKPPEAERG